MSFCRNAGITVIGQVIGGPFYLFFLPFFYLLMPDMSGDNRKSPSDIFDQHILTFEDIRSLDNYPLHSESLQK